MKLKSFWLRKKVKNAGKRQFLSLKHIEGGKKRLGNLLNIYWTRREYLYVKVFNFEKKNSLSNSPPHNLFTKRQNVLHIADSITGSYLYSCFDRKSTRSLFKKAERKYLSLLPFLLGIPTTQGGFATWLCCCVTCMYEVYKGKRSIYPSNKYSKSCRKTLAYNTYGIFIIARKYLCMENPKQPATLQHYKRAKDGTTLFYIHCGWFRQLLL